MKSCLRTCLNLVSGFLLTLEKFEAILARQTPDAEKRKRANYVIDTGTGLDAARQAVNNIIAEMAGESAFGSR